MSATELGSLAHRISQDGIRPSLALEIAKVEQARLQYQENDSQENLNAWFSAWDRLFSVEMRANIIAGRV